MNRNIRLKALEKKMMPADTTIKAKLPEWLQPGDYVEPVFSGSLGRVIKPKGYLALQPDGTVRYQE